MYDREVSSNFFFNDRFSYLYDLKRLEIKATYLPDVYIKKHIEYMTGIDKVLRQYISLITTKIHEANKGLFTTGDIVRDYVEKIQHHDLQMIKEGIPTQEFASMIKMLKDEVKVDGDITVNRNYGYKNIRSIFRCRNVDTRKCVLNASTFGRSIFMHLYWTEKTVGPDHPSTIILTTIVSALNTIKVDSITLHYLDDIIRQILSLIDKMSFKMVHDDSVALKTFYIHVTGLSSMGGPRGWTTAQIHDKVNDWVSGTCRWDTGVTLWCEKTMDRFAEEWSSKRLDSKLSYHEYLTDPMRWATSGGAPATKVSGLGSSDESIRSKWAWILERLSRGYTSGKLIRELKQAKQTAGAAIKEEDKTRVIITTPMESYIRQCYIYYCLGEPNFLKSTIVTKNITEKIIRNSSNYTYICIDASKFDHDIPKELLVYFLRRLEWYSRQYRDYEVADVLQEEISHMNDLVVDYMGKEYKYERGILSGWKFTSLFGTMITNMVCEYIRETLGLTMEYMTQGDDIIIMTEDEVDKEEVLALVRKFGLHVNEKKTTIGKSGEFLKYVYFNNMAFGYTARSVRTIFYSNPWLDPRSVTSMGSISMKWFTYLSRLGMCLNKKPPIDEFLKDIAKDVSRWLGKRKNNANIIAMLKTPSTLGGLGVHETTNYDDYEYVIPTFFNTDESKTAKTRVFSLFGVNTEGMVIKEKRLSKKTIQLSIKSYSRAFKYILSQIDEEPPPKKPEDCNLFKSCFGYISRMKRCPKIVDIIYSACEGKEVDMAKYAPPLGGTRRWYNVLRILLQMDNVHMPNSCYLDNRYDSAINRRVNRISQSIFLHQRFNSVKHQMMLACYIITLFLTEKTYLHSL